MNITDYAGIKIKLMIFWYSPYMQEHINQNMCAPLL